MAEVLLECLGKLNDFILIEQNLVSNQPRLKVLLVISVFAEKAIIAFDNLHTLDSLLDLFI